MNRRGSLSHVWSMWMQPIKTKYYEFSPPTESYKSFYQKALNKNCAALDRLTERVLQYGSLVFQFSFCSSLLFSFLVSKQMSIFTWQMNILETQRFSDGMLCRMRCNVKQALHVSKIPTLII
jgi:hypothetical protein